MSIKQQGGVFGRNPTFNDVTVDGTLTVNGEPISDFGTMAQQDADSVNIDGGAIDGTIVGGSTPVAGGFSEVLANTTTKRGSDASGVFQDGVAIIASDNSAITQEIVASDSGTFTTITVSFDTTDSTGCCIMEILMTGFSGKYLDYVAGIYSNQADVVIRDNNDGVTSVALSGSSFSSWTATITTSVTHPVVKVKATTGRSSGTFNNPPTVTFA